MARGLPESKLGALTELGTRTQPIKEEALKPKSKCASCYILEFSLDKDKKRSLRRHYKNRMKTKAKKIYHWLKPEQAIKSADHLKVCSCYMCGNPRKFKEGPTIQELRHTPPSSNGRTPDSDSENEGSNPSGGSI